MAPFTLWQAALDWLARGPFTEPDGSRDRPLVVALFVELYLLGERPTVDEVAAYLDERRLRGPRWRTAILRLWRDRLANPTKPTRPPGSWRYPFVVPERLIADHNLPPSVTDRLIRSVSEAAADYMRVAELEPGSKRAGAAKRLFIVTSNAIRLRALTHDAAGDDVHWPSILFREVTALDHVEGRLTRAGIARTEARLERWVAERNELERRLALENDGKE